jgi:hypothetical protein
MKSSKVSEMQHDSGPIRGLRGLFQGTTGSLPRDSGGPSRRLEGFIEETRGSLQSDSRVSSKRLLGFIEETSRVSSKRLAGLFDETQVFLQRPSGVSSKRVGDFFEETQGSFQRDSGISSKRLRGLFKETRGSLPGDSEVSSRSLGGLFKEWPRPIGESWRVITAFGRGCRRGIAGPSRMCRQPRREQTSPALKRHTIAFACGTSPMTIASPVKPKTGVVVFVADVRGEPGRQPRAHTIQNCTPCASRYVRAFAPCR